MPGQAIQVGPFIGGLNTFSDPSAVADNELVVCENFELDLDGSMKSRPPIQDIDEDFTLDTTGNIKLLGYFYVGSSAPYLLASDGNSSTYYFSSGAWTLITNTLSAAAFVQFDGKAWLTAAFGSAQTGGYWTPSGGFTTDSDMPKGDAITVYKERLWIAPGKNAATLGTRLYRSRTVADPSIWQAVNDFRDVGSGDGQNIVGLAVYFNTLLIFRTNSIYGLQYATDPAAAVESLIVPNVGLASVESIDQFESFIYFIYEDKAYEFSNNRAAQINVKVPFTYTSTSGIYLPYSVSVFNRRVIFNYYDKTYVYNLRTRTWTTWKSDVFGPIGKIIRQEMAGSVPVAVTHQSVVVPSGGSRAALTLTITDEINNVTENMTCVIQTKNFNYQASSVYKRLFWWGIDASFKQSVEGFAYPITYNFFTTWQQLFSLTWNSRLTFSWGRPNSEPTFAESDVDVSNDIFGRKFVKFFKSLRFRQIYYRVEFDNDGSTATAPVRLFSLMTYVNPKETVSTTVS